MPRETSAGVIIFQNEKQDRKYLLLHYPEGHWDFAKGKIEQGETEEETAKREAAEEAGITQLQFIPGFKEKISWFFRRDGVTIYKEATFFLAMTKQKEVKLSYEHKGFTWLPFEEAAEKVTYKNAKELLKKAEQFLQKKREQLQKYL
ncbi:NUDIX domain-containing protein [Candidatus Woesearchaeota archaeon]|nr:NUDIX domain-containing protein [Candidatus Woesearchaeota archaeon]